MDKYDDLPMDFRDFSVYRLPGKKRFLHVLDA
jgi:hypothetical protein